MEIQKNISLKKMHTFGIQTIAKEYIQIDSVAVLKQLLPITTPFLILGGGSNLLFTKDFEGLVIHNLIKGIECIEETDEKVKISIGAGEIWHELVLWSIDNRYSGIENLSLIPGTVGAAPIQNIGAYGVELKDVFYALEAIDLKTGERITFYHKDCQFGYRDSIFKKELKGKYCITKVIIELSKVPQLNVSYGAIQEVLDQKNLKPSTQAISAIVIEIRTQKLPDPKKIGNSGSFFKNPIISINQYLELKKKYPLMPSYTISDTLVKVPAGWLIDQLGWKGYRKGDAGVHKNQALVLVNYDNAAGAEIWELAQEIQKNVHSKYQINISPEVNIL